jgi:acetylornithine/succinyldiaminopimelate/putrescine aminotransferase
VAWQDVESLEKAVTPEVAAVLLEPVQGEGGVWPAGAEYFRAVRRLCDQRDILFMVDEVQTGLGRTGRWWGFQHYGVRPDVVTIAKALGNGVPIGACWARSEVASAFVPGDHATTFGGQPLAASAARATLAVMEAQDVPRRAEERGNYLREKLAGLPSVRTVRGLGLLLGAELARGGAPAVVAKCLERGLVVNAVTDSALRLAPSLLVSEAEIDEAVGVLGPVLEDASA